jgi:ATP synthase protein I
MKKKFENPLIAVGIMGAIGVEIALFILIGYYIGSLIKDSTGSIGWVIGGVLTGLFVGIGLAILVVIKMMEGSDG